MEVSFLDQEKVNKTNLLIVPVFGKEKNEEHCPEELIEFIKLRIANKDFTGKAGETLTAYLDYEEYPGKIVLLGMGEAEKISKKNIRETIATAIKQIKKHKQTDISLYLPPILNPYLQYISEAFELANYNPAKFLSGKQKEEAEKSEIQKVYLISAETNKKNLKKLNESIAKGLAIGDAVNDVRDLVNAPHNKMHTDTMVENAKEIAKFEKLKISILDEKQLAELGMGAFLGVSGASEHAPKMVVLEYKAEKPTKKTPIVLVGKGICFDAGGYNLKPTGGISDMKMDMAGAATIMGVFELLRELDIKRNVIGVLALTENLIGPTAQKPNDIVKTYSGKTVEVTNTDAEGRLILADAISYAIDTYKPELVIDLATLTGAIMIGLGEDYAGLFSNDTEITKAILKAGKRTDEEVWHMPIHKNVSKKLKGKISDLVNWAPGGLAGASMGAAFIEKFVGKTKWAHLDIAGTAFVKEPKAYDYQGATGYGVRLLIELLSKM